MNAKWQITVQNCTSQLGNATKVCIATPAISLSELLLYCQIHRYALLTVLWAFTCQEISFNIHRKCKDRNTFDD